MARKKLTPEQLKHKQLGDRMKNEHKTICEYCGEEKEGLMFVIGTSSKPDWVMNIGTGKISCAKPECIEKAQAEKQILRDKGAIF